MHVNDDSLHYYDLLKWFYRNLDKLFKLRKYVALIFFKYFLFLEEFLFKINLFLFFIFYTLSSIFYSEIYILNIYNN